MRTIAVKDLCVNGVAFPRALDVLTRAGMPWRWARPQDYTQNSHHVDYGTWRRQVRLIRTAWTGKILRVTMERTSSDILHELGHWLVATPAQRLRPEYGLGRAPWTDIDPNGRIGEARLDEIDDHTHAEYLACMIDVYLHRLLRGHWLARAAHDLTLCDYTSGFGGGGRRTSWAEFTACDEYIGTDVRLAAYALWAELGQRGLLARVEALAPGQKRPEKREGHASPGARSTERTTDSARSFL